MSNPRFTIAAGVLGMALCGLAAVANSSSKTGSSLGCFRANKTDQPAEPSSDNHQVALKVVSDPPVDIPPVTPPIIDMSLLEKQATAPPPLAIPVIPEPAVIPPLTPTVEPVQLAIPKIQDPAPPAVSPPILIVPEVKPAPQIVAKPEIPQAEPLPPPASTRTVPTASPAVEGVKIIVQMNAGKPSLTILSENAEMLTLTCETLDLAARSPGDESVSGIKASGKVTFTAPGCQGSCDELLLNPKSWDGTMLKNVKAKCTGTGSTELAADKMTFKLRSPRENVVPTIPASHAMPSR